MASVNHQGKHTKLRSERNVGTYSKSRQLIAHKLANDDETAFG
jgi:hypothetical protein